MYLRRQPIGNAPQHTRLSHTSIEPRRPARSARARVISYTYDALYRLNAATYSTSECYQYGYDKIGNRTAQTATVTCTLVTAYAYDAADRLTNASGQGYTWDNNGSLTNNGKFTFTYNNAERLTRAQGITATQVYTYNGEGLLMNRNATRYVWDQASDLPQMLSDGSTLYVAGVGQWNGTAWVYDLIDGLGSVRQLSDALLEKREVALRGSVLRHVSVRDLRAMRIVSQPHRQLTPRLGFGETQRAFEIHKLAGGRRAKAMHAASPDVQLIAGLPHLPLQPILPVPGLLLRQIDKRPG